MVNQRTGEVLFTDVILVRRMAERAKGLLGTTSIPPGRALLIEPARQVHTFGMKYPIDVVFCSRDMKVLRVVRNLEPNRLTALRWRARCVLECASGSTRGIRTGDVLEVQPIDL